MLLYMTLGPALILVNKQIPTCPDGFATYVGERLDQASSAIGATFVVKIMKWQPLSDQAQKMTWSFYRRNMVVAARPSASLCSATRATCTSRCPSCRCSRRSPCVVVATLYADELTRSQKVSLSVLAHVSVR